MTMAASMPAMMLPTALPFFIAYARDVSRPASIALVVAAYTVVWAIIGLIANLVMGAVMLPAAAYVVGIAIAFAGLYVLTPWMRHAQACCQEMCLQTRRDPSLGKALSTGLRYSANCILCSAGVMVALVVLGMSSVLLMIAGSAVILVYKIAGAWPRRIELALSTVLVIAGLALVR
jgi:predicted metal-binding membrane protein